MKWLVVLLCAVGLCLTLGMAPSLLPYRNFNDFLRALNMREASGRKVNVPKGDNGKAIGPFQTHYIYWFDATHEETVTYEKRGKKTVKVSHWIKVKPGEYKDCEKYEYASKVVYWYLQKYAPEALEAGDWETCSRVHNGGPDGDSKTATIKYWDNNRKKQPKGVKQWLYKS